MTLPSAHELVDPIAVLVPDDTKFLGDKLDKIIALLNEQTGRRETPAPTSLPFPIQTRSTRIRCLYLVLTASAAATVNFNVGAGVRHTYIFGAADTKVFPIFENIEQGNDVSLTASAGTASGYIIGYVDD